DERDDIAYRVVLKAQGMEQKGKGAASAVVTSWLEPHDGSTTVKIQADITLSGLVAQVSRGLLPDISSRLTQEFADCLQARMTAEGVVGPTAEPPHGQETDAVKASRRDSPSTPAAAKPDGGLRLGVRAH